MLFYLVKSSLCLILILLFYKLVLENEKAHHFKRIFLLGGILFSLLVPLLSFSFAIDPLSEVSITTFQELNNQTGLNQVTETVISTPRPGILLLVYLTGVSFFGLRFLISLKKIVNRIKTGKQIKTKKHVLVLMPESSIPHSFLNFIFVCKEDYDNGEIAPEIIEHEQIHVKQKHTLDLFLVEILQILLWFNPGVAFYRSLIQRNHEFLADEGVVRQHSSPGTYAAILLKHSSGFPQQVMISPFKSQFIKTRILMMTKRPSPRRIFKKTIAVIPMLIIAILLFSNSGMAGSTPGNLSLTQLPPFVDQASNRGQETKDQPHINVIIDAKKNILLENLPLQMNELKPAVNKILNSYPELKNQKVVLRVYADASIPIGFISDVEQQIFDAHPNVYKRMRYLLETTDTYLDGGMDWFQEKASGSQPLKRGF